MPGGHLSLPVLSIPWETFTSRTARRIFRRFLSCIGLLYGLVVGFIRRASGRFNEPSCGALHISVVSTGMFRIRL